MLDLLSFVFIAHEKCVWGVDHDYILEAHSGDVEQNRSPFITPLELTGQEEKDLVEFLKALEGESIVVSIPQLP